MAGPATRATTLGRSAAHGASRDARIGRTLLEGVRFIKNGCFRRRLVGIRRHEGFIGRAFVVGSVPRPGTASRPAAAWIARAIGSFPGCSGRHGFALRIRNFFARLVCFSHYLLLGLARRMLHPYLTLLPLSRCCFGTVRASTSLTFWRPSLTSLVRI